VRSDHGENVSVAGSGVVESRCIDKRNSASFEIKRLRGLYTNGGRLHLFSYREIRAAEEINKLRESQPTIQLWLKSTQRSPTFSLFQLGP
jgi:hypothetical protein